MASLLSLNSWCARFVYQKMLHLVPNVTTLANIPLVGSSPLGDSEALMSKWLCTTRRFWALESKIIQLQQLIDMNLKFIQRFLVFQLTWHPKLFTAIGNKGPIYRFKLWYILPHGWGLCGSVAHSTGSGRVFSGFGIWPKNGAWIGKTISILTGSGIWLFPGKRDSPKIWDGMRDLCLHVCR